MAFSAPIAKNETFSSSPAQANFGSTLVVIDASVADSAMLAAEVVPGSIAVLLDAQQDGIEQITQALRQHPQVTSLHIVSHGAPGTLFISNSELSLSTLDRYRCDLQSWSLQSLVLYGCNVAAGDAGTELIEKLHALTGANIAASATPTGNAALGGNWNLDVQTGAVAVELALTLEAQQAYAGILGPTVDISGSLSANGSTPQLLAPNAVISGVSGNLLGAKVSFGTGSFTSSDRLGLQGAGTSTSGTIAGTSISWNYSTSTGTLTFTGSGTAAQYESAFKQVVYYSTGSTTNGSRQIDFAIGENLANTNNGHFYEYVSGTLTWQQARDIAAQQTYFGLQGYLATVTTAAENTFITNKLGGNGWIGGSDEEAEGTWKWVTGPESGTLMSSYYTNWASNEPNNFGGNEDHAHFWGTGTQKGTWNDFLYNNGQIAGYVIEYGGMAGDPVVDLTGSVTVNVNYPVQTAAPTGLKLPSDTTNDTGISQTDRITSNLRPQFQGTAVPGSTIKLYADGVEIAGNSTIDGSGNWTFTPSADLAIGTRNITARATAPGSTQSANSAGITVTIDNTAPTINLTSKPDLNANSDKGVSNSDDKTNLTSLTFDGTLTPAEAGLTIKVYDGNSVVGQGVVSGTGAWSVNTTGVGTGNRSITYTLSDAAGNESQKSAALTIDVNTTAPTLPAGSTPDLTAATDTGIFDADNNTGENTPDFAGQLTANEAGYTITLYDGSTPVGTGVVQADGSWLVTTSELNDGSHAIQYSLTDLHGNQSQLSSALSINVNTVDPNASTIAPDLTEASDTGISRTDNITANNTPTFSGTGTAGQIVRLYDGDTQVGEGTVDGNGNWSIKTSALSVGDRIITSIVVDPLTGNESGKSPALNVKIDPNAGVTPTLTPGSSNGGSNPVGNENGGLTNNNQLPFSGKVEPGSTIEILANGQKIEGTATVNPDGAWSFTPSTPLLDGTYQMTVRSTNGSGGVTLSPETSLTIDTKPATVQILDFGAKVRDTSVNSLSFKFSEAVKNVQLDDLVITRDGQPVSLTSAKLSTQDNQIFTLENIPGLTNPGGNYQISIKPSSTITDLAGNSLMVGNNDTWLTGFTADALPAPRRGGKRGLVVSDFGGKNFVMGSMNRDVMRGLGGNDTLFGFGGNDRQVGGAGKDKLSGGGGNDHLLGGTGNDNCRGRNGHDTLMGAVGRDRLLGNNGNDVLIGGGGKDILNGGAGRDTFRVDTIEKVSDRVVDFNSASDLIDLRGIFKSAQFAADNRFAQYHQYTKLVQVGANIEVQVDGDGKGSNTTFSTVLTLQNTLASNVKSTNFVIG
ncbi:DUF4347 domain-containing protein [Cyanobacteria bacterium FACHB-502]|nr:DUF4347 domain-containing protein [Cyanobacteria bacterium FACHB-502]